MFRGTTPTHNFKVPFDTANIELLNIAYSQYDNVIIEKGLGDCEITEDTISVTLTEDDTLAFDSDKKTVDIQIRVRLAGGVYMASKIMTVQVKKILKEGVLW